MKCRLSERIIELAQNLQQRPDSEIELEKAILRQLYHQTYEDLHHFIKKRDKKPWRTWDKYHLLGNYIKPTFSKQVPYDKLCFEYDELLYFMDCAEDYYTMMIDDM